MDVKLADLPVKKTGIIKEVLENEISSKLFELGVLPGSNFIIVARAPLGGPICIKIGNSLIVLRKKEAASITIQ